MAQTLLLGLGGTGSRVVNYVADDLKKKHISINDGNICCTVLDTNDNDRKKIRESGVGVPIVPTSKDRIIQDYIKMYADKGVDSWMPRSAALDMESMKDGASQMRPKSRLAFMDIIADKTIRDLETQIDKLFDNRDDAKIRVMIVSSLAGGTGSGMFIQMALWLRRYFASRKCAITIRGIFILPDVFINTIEDIRKDETEIQSLYANAYGAIRELNAITKIKTKGYVPALPIKLDGLFDSEVGQPDGQPVYDYAFFIDDISEGGSVLSQIDHYEQVAARLVYMQLYAPMHDDLYSEEDNLFKRFQKSPEPVFGSCGTAKAVYPAEDVLKYCSLKAVQESISMGWRRIDEEIDAKQKKEEEQENQGKVLTKRISPRGEYIRLFDSKTSKSGDKVGRERLFLNIANDVNNEERVPDADGFSQVNYTDKVEDFISLLKEEIAMKVDTDDPGSLSRIKLQKTWKDKTTETRVTLKKLVEDKKKDVRRFLDQVDELANGMAEELLDSVCPADMGDINEENAASIFGFLTKKNSNEETIFVHPIAVRYLLYKLSARIEEIKGAVALDKSRSCAEKGHGNGKNKISFDNPKTRSVEDDAIAYLDSKKGMQKETTFIKFFMGKYAEHNGSQFELCRAYAIEMVEHELAILLSKRLEKLIAPVEAFFKNLGKVSKKIQDELDENIRKNEKIEQKIIFVCATEKEKDALYESLRVNTGVSDTAINAMVVRSLYGKFCAEENPDADNNQEYSGKSIEATFYIDALSAYKKMILKNNKEDIDLDIYSAICKSSDIEYEEAKKKEEAAGLDDSFDIDWETGESSERKERHQRHVDAMEAMAKKLFNLGAPFLISNDEEPSDMADETSTKVEAEDEKFIPIKKRKTFWGFNPLVADKCPELAKILGVNVKTQGNKIYAKNELDCYRAVYGIQAGYVEKFNELAGGDYYTNYQQVVKDMVEGVKDGRQDELIHTPHLDKTWHKFLPYITPEKQKEEDEKFYRLFWLAVAYGMITVTNAGKFEITRFKKTELGKVYPVKEPITYNGTAVGKVDVLEMLAAMKLDDAFLLDAASLEKKFAEECENIDIYEGTEFLRGKTIKETVKKEEDGGTATVKVQSGGLGTKGDTNAVTLIVRYYNSKKHDLNVAATLIQSLEDLCYKLVENNYERNEEDKIKAKAYEICHRIFKESGMRNKDIELLYHWKEAWSKSSI